jgi:hypothetical protein
MLTAPQLILTAHLLNFNWRDLTIGDSFDWGFQIADFGFIKRIEFLFYREKSAMRWKV